MTIQEATHVQFLFSSFFLLGVLLSYCWKLDGITTKNPFGVISILGGSLIIVGTKTTQDVRIFDLCLHLATLFVICVRSRIVRQRGFVLLLLLFLGELGTILSVESSHDDQIALATTSFLSLIAGLLLSISVATSDDMLGACEDDEYPFLALFFALVNVQNVIYYAFAHWNVPTHALQYALLATRNLILLLLLIPFFSDMDVSM